MASYTDLYKKALKKRKEVQSKKKTTAPKAEKKEAKGE